MTNNEDPKDNLILQLQKDWKQLDQIGSESAPGKAALMEQLELARTEKRKAFYKELRLFIFIALLILTAMTTFVFMAPKYFFWTQIFSLVAAPIIFLILSKTKAKEAYFYDR